MPLILSFKEVDWPLGSGAQPRDVLAVLSDDQSRAFPEIRTTHNKIEAARRQ
jgi:hypothetical protein